MDWEHIYKFCLVHFQRSVERVKTNFAVVGHGRQDEFQKLVNVLLSDTTTEEEFLETVETMLRDFPHTRNWIRWYFEHSRGCLVFPAMQNGTIKGHGDTTNAQEDIGRWFKTRAMIRSNIKNPTLEEGLGIMLREGQTVQDEYSHELRGIRTAYGKRSNPIQREKARADKRSGRNKSKRSRSIETL